MHVLFRDFETRSTLDLKRVGAWHYASNPTTDVWCFSYAVDDGIVKTWTPVDPIPPEWIEACQNPDFTVSAFNDFFERMIEAHVMAPRYGWPTVPIERHRCTQASALAMGLPDNLEEVALALKLGHQKDKAGRQNMLDMAKPRKPRKDEDPTGIYWCDSPAQLEIQYRYNRKDVEVERAVHARIGHISPEEQALWVMNEAVNDRGVHIDYALVEAAIRIVTPAREQINAELAKITDGTVTTVGQDERLIAWLGAQGCVIENIKKATVTETLARKELTPKVKRVLELRRDGAPAAAGKFKPLLAWRNSDDRVRGGFKYHGCHTGRFSSHGVQFQNFKKPEIDDLGGAITAVVTGDLEHLRRLNPQPLSVLGDVTRATIHAAPGHEFFIGDFSGVESRVLARLANERSKLELWAKSDASGLPEHDVYFIGGVNYFKFPPDQARSYGKTGDLGFGFGGGIPAWRKFAPRGDNTSDAAIRRYQAAWRAAHPMTDKFRSALGHGTINAVEKRGRVFECGEHISVKCDEDGAFLRIRLPSGRENAYPAPRLMTTKRGEKAVTYLGAPKDKDSKEDRGAWYGLWCENVVQAAARDLLTAAMLRLDAHGYKIVAHVHDEIVCEAPIDTRDLDEFKRIITALPDWAAGMPMAVKVRKGDRFCEIRAPAPAAAAPISEEREAEPEITAEPSNTFEYTREKAYSEEDTCDSSANTTHDNHDYSTIGGCGEKDSFGPSFVYFDKDGQPYLQTTRTVRKGKRHFRNGVGMAKNGCLVRKR